MPDFIDLEALVRAARPAPDPAWAERLDRRAAERFPRPARWWQWSRLGPQLVVAGGLASAVLVVVLIASYAGGGSTNTSSSGGGVAVSKVGAAPEKSAAGSARSDSAAAPTPVTAQDRSVIRDVAITLSTRPADIEDVSDRALRVADALGGYVQDSSVTARQSAQLTLRVPQDKLQTALSQLSRLAHVRSRTQNTQDVTDERSSLESAVRDARAYRDSLRRRLAHASSDREASSLRGRLQRAESALRSRERAVARLDHETSLATIDVHVTADRHAGAAPSGGPWTPGDALHDAGRVLEVIAGVALIALAVGVPLAVVAALAALLARVYNRRRRERALELA
jgi:hypothetical protein